VGNRSKKTGNFLYIKECNCCKEMKGVAITALHVYSTISA
jgi:hypothetical protein